MDRFSKLNDRELYQFYLDHEDDEELCEKIEKIERFIKYTEKNDYTVWRRTQEWYHRGFDEQNSNAKDKREENTNGASSTEDPVAALHEAQDSFKGEAERQNINDESDVVQLVREIRTRKAGQLPLNIDYDKLREKFTDRIFAERFFTLTTELSDFTVDEIIPGPKLPYENDYDPGHLVVYMKGCNNDTGKTVEHLFFEETPNKENLNAAHIIYLNSVWSRYPILFDEDLENLPDVYCISFCSDADHIDQPICRLRWKESQDGSEEKDAGVGDYFNLINKEADSEIMRMIDAVV